MKTIIIALLATQTLLAFEPQYVETQSYKVETSRQYESQNAPRFCRFETRLDESKSVIKNSRLCCRLTDRLFWMEYGIRP